MGVNFASPKGINSTLPLPYATIVLTPLKKNYKLLKNRLITFVSIPISVD